MGFRIGFEEERRHDGEEHPDGRELVAPRAVAGDESRLRPMMNREAATR